MFFFFKKKKNKKKEESNVNISGKERLGLCDSAWPNFAQNFVWLSKPKLDIINTKNKINMLNMYLNF